MNQDIRKIYSSLLSRLLDGRFDSLGLLPKEIDLAHEFETNRMNAHRAVKLLEKHNLVTRKKNVGTTVNPNFDREKVSELFKEANRQIYVMYSSTPHYVHWNQSSFENLEKIVEAEGYTVVYQLLPSSGERSDFDEALRAISEANASALIIFPDSDDESFFNENSDLLLDFQMPVFVLNRSGQPMFLDMVSFVEMDLFSDGLYVGNLLRKNKVNNVVMVKQEHAFWSLRRCEGVKMGYSRNSIEGDSHIDDFECDSEGIAQTITAISESRGDIVVVAIHNEIAARMIDAARKKGLRISEDYQLIAFDDHPLYRSYKLTSMAVPTAKVGEIFAHMILDKSWLGDHRGKISIKLGSELVVRDTYVPKIIG